VSKKPDSNLSRREQMRAERRRSKLAWNVILLGTVGVVVLLIAWYVLATARPGALPGEVTVPDEGRAHVRALNQDGSPSGTRVTFQTYPPTSGTHYGDLVAPWGVYTPAQPIQPPFPADTPYDLEGIFVHNLEHGGVVFLYACADNCAELEQQFRGLYAKAGPPAGCADPKILVTPYTRDLPAPIVALAWDHRLNVAAFDEGLLLRWYQRFVDRGPEKAC
jgi:hypothetical protein